MMEPVTNTIHNILAKINKSLNSDDPSVTANTLLQVSGLEKKAAPALPIIFELCHSPNHLIRSAAAAAISRINDLPEQSIPVLIALLDDENITVQRYAAAGLCLFKHSELVNLGVIKNLDTAYDKSDDNRVRSFIGSILARRAEPRVSLST